MDADDHEKKASDLNETGADLGDDLRDRLVQGKDKVQDAWDDNHEEFEDETELDRADREAQQRSERAV